MFFSTLWKIKRGHKECFLRAIAFAIMLIQSIALPVLACSVAPRQGGIQTADNG